MSFDLDLDQYPVYKQSNWSADLGDGTPYLKLTLGFIVGVFVVEYYLDTRQLRTYRKGGSLPSDLVDYVSTETFDKSVAYGRDKFTFKMFESLFMFVEGVAFLLLGYLPYAWDFAASLVSTYKLPYFATPYSPIFEEILITWAFIVIMTISDTIISLPFSLYSTFVVEQKHGFNKSTVGLFFQDKIMTIALTFVLGLPILSAIVWLVRAGGEHFYFYVWAFLLVVSIVMMTIYPEWIAPLFNKYDPLPEGETKAAIEAMAKTVDFPLTKLFTVDGSRRSAHSNAYFYGFFKNKRIVMYDTLMKQVELPELLAILGHEIGHWKLWHTAQGFVITQLYIFCLFLSFSYVQNSRSLFAAFGFAYDGSVQLPVFVGLMLFAQTFWSPVEKVLTLLMTMNSRKNEFAADQFAVSMGHAEALSTGLIKISVENLSNMIPDPWYSAYHYSHPPLVERLGAIGTHTKSSMSSSNRSTSDSKSKKSGGSAKKRKE